MIRLVADQDMDLTNIVDDLLVAAKSEAGTLVVASVRVDLRAQAAQVLEAWGSDVAGTMLPVSPRRWVWAFPSPANSPSSWGET
jgi:hypothetical protein